MGERRLHLTTVIPCVNAFVKHPVEEIFQKSSKNCTAIGSFLDIKIWRQLDSKYFVSNLILKT
jgi:hypothetical protein